MTAEGERHLMDSLRFDKLPDNDNDSDNDSDNDNDIPHFIQAVCLHI